MDAQISIIIPVYNAEKTIVRCVESLVYGKEKSIEIILIDDCSSDGSWKICQELKKRYKNIYCSQNFKNRGVSFTRNRGLDLARGKYILFVDSDDWVSGNYVKQLIQSMEKHREQLVLCGYYYVNQLVDTKQTFLYSDDSGESVIKPKCYFSLIEAILIQQLWNKVFLHDVIRQHSIRFDETQSMGEDFQFVLDYMKAARLKSCRVLNQPLYYYVRATTNSLMSKMGLSGFERSLDRLNQFGKLAGLLDTNEYKKQINSLKQNYLYQIVHDSASTKKEKIDNIESVMQDGTAKFYYRKLCVTMVKEQFGDLRRKILDFKIRLLSRVRRGKRDYLLEEMKFHLKIKNFTVISQNCIGGVFYHDMKIQFFSPTINLFFSAGDFIQFVCNLEKYLNMEMKIYWDETYPIGILGNVKIHFMHYKTCTDAREKWEKRKKRIFMDKIVILATDRNGFDDELFEKWKHITYPKVLFTSQKRYSEEVDSVYFPEYEENGFVPDLIPKREFYRDNILINTVNRLI